MQVSDFPALRTVICVTVSLLLAGCSGIPSGMARSNLKAGSVQIIDATPTEGTSFQVRFSFSNTGVVSPGSGFWIRLEILDEFGAAVAIPNQNQRFNQSMEKDEVAQVTWTIPDGLNAGEFTAIAKLDTNGEINETTTDDNSNFRDFTVIELNTN